MKFLNLKNKKSLFNNKLNNFKKIKSGMKNF